MCCLAEILQEGHRVDDPSYPEAPQAWKCSKQPWPTGLFRNRPREGLHPACSRKSASCMGPRPQSMQNTFKSVARALIGSILMKILLATRDTTVDSLPLFSARMGRQFLDIEAIQGRTVVGTEYQRAEYLQL